MIQETSLEALNSLGESKGAMKSKIFKLIQEKGGMTCDEVEVALNMKHQTVSARIRDLRSEAAIRDYSERRRTRSGRNAVVWKPYMKSF